MDIRYCNELDDYEEYENYDDLDDYTFLDYLREYGFTFSQNGDGSEFTLVKGFRDTYNDNWYYLLRFTTNNNPKNKCIIEVEYNHKHTNNRYTYKYVNDIILPKINKFVDVFGIFNKYKIFTFCINLISDTKV